nr:MAG TPA: hypothetical protein [Bacteriophage sp.]
MLSSITITITALSILKAIVTVSLILVAYTTFTGALKEKNKDAKLALFGVTLTQIAALYLIFYTK